MSSTSASPPRLEDVEEEEQGTRKGKVPSQRPRSPAIAAFVPPATLLPSPRRFQPRHATPASSRKLLFVRGPTTSLLPSREEAATGAFPPPTAQLPRPTNSFTWPLSCPGAERTYPAINNNKVHHGAAYNTLLPPSLDHAWSCPLLLLPPPLPQPRRRQDALRRRRTLLLPLLLLLLRKDGALGAGRGDRHRGLRPDAVHLPELRVQGRLRPLPRGGGQVPPLRLLRLPLGVPLPRLPQAQGPRPRHQLLVGEAHLRADQGVGRPPGVGFSGHRRRGARRRPRPLQRRQERQGSVRDREHELHRQAHRSRAVGQAAEDGGEQREQRDHPDAQRRVQRHRGEPRAGPQPGAPPGLHRRGQRPRLRRHQQRRLQVRLRQEAGAVRRGRHQAVRGSGQVRGDPGQAAVHVRQPAHRGRRAPLRHAHKIRRGLRGSLQVQQEAPEGVPQPVQLHQGHVPDPRDQQHGEHGAHQEALLREPPLHQPLWDHPPRPQHRLQCPT